MAGYFDDDANEAAVAKRHETAMASRTAPVSPIATQETDKAALAAARIYIRGWRDAWNVYEETSEGDVLLARHETEWEARAFHDRYIIQRAVDAVVAAPKDALSSAERRIEELGRERLAAWMIHHSVATGHGDTFDDLLGELGGFVTTLKAEVEELKRRPDMLRQLLDEANAAHFDATMRAEAAESALASQTGLVEDMRAALEPFSAMAGALFGQNRNDPDVVFSALNPASEYLSITAGDFFAARRAAIRSLALPGISTMGDGGGPDVARLRHECATSDFHEHDGCSCSDAELVARALPRPPVEPEEDRT